MRALLIPLGDDRYAIGAERIREVSPRPQPTPLPAAPAAVVGLLNLRGEIVPLLDTAILLGLDVTAPPTFAVVVRSPLGPAALTATGLPEVVTLDESIGPSDLPSSLGRFRIGSRMVVVLDVDALLAIARGDPTVLVGAGR